MKKAHLEKAVVLAALMRLDVDELAFKAKRQEVHKAIGEELRSKRKLKQVSLRELARRMNLSAAYVSDVELGRRAVTIKFADAYLEMLN